MLVNKFLKEIGDDEITVWDGAYSSLCLLFEWNNIKYINSSYKTPATPAINIIKNRNSMLAFNNTSYLGYAFEIFDRYMKKSAKVIEQINASKQLSSEIEKLYFKTQSANLNNISEKQLIEWLSDANNKISRLEALTIFVETFNEEIAASVMGNNAQQLKNIWNLASEPIFVPFEIRRLALIIEEFEKNNNFAIKNLQFIYTDYFSSKEEKKVEILLNRFMGNQAIITESKNKVKEFKIKNIAKIHEYNKWLSTLNKKDRKLANYVQLIMEIRDWRKDPIAQAQTLFFNIGKELLLRAKIENKVLPYLLVQELMSGVQWLKKNKSNLANRKNGIISLLNTDGSFENYHGNIAESKKILKTSLLKHKKIENNILTGQVGSKGIATGNVRIIKDAARSSHFKDGEILVTGMTRPEFVPLMLKAAAIITDEGGITCHAAIVSRELKKPCIIGTKVATKLLKNGDLVEVNANLGTIKILKR